jgi:hypothetical protein
MAGKRGDDPRSVGDQDADSMPVGPPATVVEAAGPLFQNDSFVQ